MPPFSDPEHVFYSLSLKPPFAFEGLTARVFPLRANLDALQRLCNSYVNIAPPHVGRFRAMMPYVYLMMLDYGKLAEQATNMGWIAQREIFFCIPVEWYCVIDGRWMFRDWATITPFIFVDDDLSVPLGRIVYGWPKTMARLTPTLSRWMKDPRLPVSEATVSSMVFPELYEGRRLEERVFLQVDRDAPMSVLRYPVDARANPFAPWVMASNVADAMAGWMRDIVGMMAGLGIMPMHAGSNPNNYAAMMAKAAESANPLCPNLLSNTINLKQFRQSQDPFHYCYQAITNGPMRTTSFNRGGVLGEDHIMAGDVSGGYRIKLLEWPSLPIAQTLGLEIESRNRGDGADVVHLRPVLPFWYDVNMEYLPGYNLAWRTHDGVWRDEAGGELTSKAAVTDDDRMFNTTLASAVDTLAGPFRFSGTSIRVMPLLARRKTLETFLDSYLNTPLRSTNERFSLWAAPERVDRDDDYTYVYLTATSFGDVTSKTNNVGDWADSELGFHIAVKRERRVDAVDGETWSLCGVGLVPAFTYVDDTTAAVARVEVLGIPTSRAEFISPESAWMTEGGSDTGATQELLRVAAEVLPAVNEGQGARMQTIVDITLGDRTSDNIDRDGRVIADRWASILQVELERKKAAKLDPTTKVALGNGRALAMELLGNRMPVSLYTLKQFRDVADPDKACYQALVRVSRILDEVLDLREIEEPLTVRIREFPTQPIVEMLGLVSKAVVDDGAGIVYALQPIRPFSLRLTMEESLGDPLYSRSGRLQWAAARAEDDDTTERRRGAKPPKGEPDVRSVLEEPGSLDVGDLIGKTQDEGDPRRLEKAVRDWKLNHREDDSKVSKPDARATIDAIEPQMVIEALLSREWGNWNDHARWLDGRETVLKYYHEQLLAVDLAHFAEREYKLFSDILALGERRPGETPVRHDAAPMIERLHELSQVRAKIETAWSVMVPAGVEAQFGIKTQDAEPLPSLPGDVLKLLKGFFALLVEANGKIILGEPAAANEHVDYAARDNIARLGELIVAVVAPVLDAINAGLPEVSQLTSSDEPPETDAAGRERWKAYRAILDQVWASRERIRRAVELVRERCELQRSAVFNKLSRAYQKPDYCIRRDSVGAEAGRLLPLSESWDDDWYFGPDVTIWQSGQP